MALTITGVGKSSDESSSSSAKSGSPTPLIGLDSDLISGLISDSISNLTSGLISAFAFTSLAENCRSGIGELWENDRAITSQRSFPSSPECPFT